jgi:hypothetical protein
MHNRDQHRGVETAPTLPMPVLPKVQSRKDFLSESHEDLKEHQAREKITKQELMPRVERIEDVLRRFENEVAGLVKTGAAKQKAILLGKEYNDNGFPILTAEEEKEQLDLQFLVAECNKVLAKIKIEADMAAYIKGKLEDETMLSVLAKLLTGRIMSNNPDNKHRTLHTLENSQLHNREVEISKEVYAAYEDMQKIIT